MLGDVKTDQGAEIPTLASGGTGSCLHCSSEPGQCCVRLDAGSRHPLGVDETLQDMEGECQTTPIHRSEGSVTGCCVQTMQFGGQ